MKRSRLRPIGKRRRRRGSAQKKAMVEFLKARGYHCWHCGAHIRYKKAANAAHKYPKGRYPELVCDTGNFYYLCSAVDVEGRRSCHQVFDGGNLQRWEQLRDSEQFMGKNLKHRSQLKYKPVT